MCFAHAFKSVSYPFKIIIEFLRKSECAWQVYGSQVTTLRSQCSPFITALGNQTRVVPLALLSAEPPHLPSFSLSSELKHRYSMSM